MNILINSNISNKIINYIIEHINLFDSFESIYLFGSILDNNKIPNDIDLLLIYEKNSIQLLDELKKISVILEERYELPIDFTILSTNEAKEVKFLNKIFPFYLKVK